MNYEIEDNVDFYKLLNMDSNENNMNFDLSNNNLCLITYEHLTENSISLPCNHNFNFLPLYNEVYNQKKMNNKYLDIARLKINQIMCPYCRNISNNLLPYIPYKNVKIIRGVNSPEKFCMKNFPVFLIRTLLKNLEPISQI